ncbi:uncharacterized protein LOC134531238 [Bacillus rossius redtenbacheri]|uniref:uncharacterized protein LOC134531238 n=1 Tax=Bacillus rossius redtenbacheri TaxID=93214 RepID=UPI002FDE826C
MKRKKDSVIDAHLKQKKREAMRRYRTKKAEKCSTNGKTPEKALGSYKCTSSLRKAVKKLQSALPSSPTKKRAVVHQLVKYIFSKAGQTLCATEKSPTLRALKPETEKKVRDFYNSDEISWQAPGKRDYKLIKNVETGEKVQEQKSYILMKVDEALALFKEKCNDAESRSKFYQLRPQNVLPLFVYSTRKLYFSDCFSTESFTHKSIIDAICCDPNSERCMTSKCENCHYDVSVLLKLECDSLQKVTWKKWGKSEDGSLKVLKNISTLAVVVQEMNDTLKSFKKHTYVKSQLFEYFDKKKQNLGKCEAVIQVDYAENYSHTPQDEIQSAHWHHSQTTVFTCCIWYINDKVK